MPSKKTPSSQKQASPQKRGSICNYKSLSQPKSNPVSPSKAKISSGQLAKDNHLILINWLKDKAHYEACFGSENKTRVGRPPSSKVNGFLLMANKLKNKTKGRLDLTSKQMRKQFKNYRAKYKKAQMAASSTGFGLNDNDEANGISSVSEKLNSMCLFYEEMDDLFGNCVYVNPLFVVDGQNDPSEPASDPNEENKEIGPQSRLNRKRSTQIEPKLSSVLDHGESNSDVSKCIYFAYIVVNSFDTFFFFKINGSPSSLHLKVFLHPRKPDDEEDESL